jgi:hypothetical protein
LEQLLSALFKQAIEDYIFLKTRNYPEKPALKLVADHYRLSRQQRAMLYRGIFAGQTCQQRKARKIHDITGQILILDGYNVLFALMNYLLGKVVFIANDGFLRDCGDRYGGIEDEVLFFKAAGLLLTHLRGTGVRQLRLYLDRNVSGSADHKAYLEEKIIFMNIIVEVLVVDSADDSLIPIANTGAGVLGTSDSQVIDATVWRVYDVAAEILVKKMSAQLIRLDC